MKKFILTGATLMAFATASFAQNTTTTNQVGTSQKAQLEQYGNEQSSNVQQVQGAGTATNIGNYGGTFQDGGAAGPNSAAINQNNGSSGNRAAAYQSGANLTSTINQNNFSGGGTAAATLQLNGGLGNYAGTQQKGGNVKATVDQNSNSQQNYATVY